MVSKRSFILVIILSVVTFGIYSLYFHYKLAQDVNKMCEGDGRHTSGLLIFILLSCITFSIYGFAWYFMLGNRLRDNGSRYSVNIKEGGGMILLLMTVGCLLLGLGPIIALYFICKNTNALAEAYNNKFVR